MTAERQQIALMIITYCTVAERHQHWELEQAKDLEDFLAVLCIRAYASKDTRLRALSGKSHR